MKGPAEIAHYFDRKTGNPTYRPAVRGVIVGSFFEDAEEAQGAAEEYLGKLQNKALPFFSERELGIDDECRMQAEVCFDKDLRLDSILHIGSLIATDAFETRYPEPSLQAFMEWVGNPSANIDPSLTALVPQIDPEDEDEDEFHLVLGEHLRYEGFNGFLIHAATPRRSYDADGNGCNLSWGWYKTTWVYGENFERAFKAAEAWVDRMIEEDKASAKEKSE